MAALLPPAVLQFLDANGKPYALGTLQTLVPGTDTPKDTWKDSGAVALNENPIGLDSAGRCIVYGDGLYRTILSDADGNLIWDQLSSTLVSVAMAPVVMAPTIADAQALLGIELGALELIAAEAARAEAAEVAEATARAAAITAEAAARTAADATLTAALAAEIARAEAAEAALGAIIAGLPAGGTMQVRSGWATSDGGAAFDVSFSPPFPTMPLTFVPLIWAHGAPAVSADLDYTVFWTSPATASGIIGAILYDGAGPSVGSPLGSTTFFWVATGF